MPASNSEARKRREERDRLRRLARIAGVPGTVLLPPVHAPADVLPPPAIIAEPEQGDQ